MAGDMVSLLRSLREDQSITSALDGIEEVSRSLENPRLKNYTHEQLVRFVRQKGYSEKEANRILTILGK